MLPRFSVSKSEYPCIVTETEHLVNSDAAQICVRDYEFEGDTVFYSVFPAASTTDRAQHGFDVGAYGYIGSGTKLSGVCSDGGFASGFDVRRRGIPEECTEEPHGLKVVPGGILLCEMVKRIDAAETDD